MKTTEAGLLVPTTQADLQWAQRWHIGELVPLKGGWFRVIHINTTEPFGLALAYERPTGRKGRKHNAS